MWANWYMLQWDFFVEGIKAAAEEDFKEDPRHDLIAKNFITFLQGDGHSYYRFREIMQLLDTMLLNVSTLQYKQRTLVAAVMFLSLGRRLSIFTTDQIVSEFPESSLYVLDDKITFNSLFNSFAFFAFGYTLAELLPAIQYCATYFGLPLHFNMPSVVSLRRLNIAEVPYPGFFSHLK
jgi:hypothetical protein